MSEAHWRAHGLLDNSFSIYSPTKGGHRSGNDAIFLAACVDPQISGPVADFGAATGAAGFAVAQRCEASHVHLIEIDEISFQHINKALDLSENSHLSSRIVPHNCDLTDGKALEQVLGEHSGKLQTIIANPPFNDAGHRISPNEDRARSHVMPKDGVERWVKAARTHLIPDGKLYWITRPSALNELLTALTPAFGGIRIRSIHGHADQPAQRILVRATKSSRAALQLLPPFIVHAADGNYTEQADAVLRGKGVMSMQTDNG